MRRIRPPVVASDLQHRWYGKGERGIPPFLLHIGLYPYTAGSDNGLWSLLGTTDDNGRLRHVDFLQHPDPLKPWPLKEGHNGVS